MSSKVVSSLTTLVLLIVVVQGSYGSSIYDFTVNDIRGTPIDFNSFKGKALLLVNVASQCGQTDSHYKALKRLHDILSFNDKFAVLAFPCNDFGEQEPWEEKEIEEFVKGHFKADFPLFKKVAITHANGAKDGQEPLWKFVIEKSGVSPSWNFQKYLFDKNGNFVQSWDSNISIESIFEKVKETMEKEEIPVIKEEL